MMATDEIITMVRTALRLGTSCRLDCAINRTPPIFYISIGGQRIDITKECAVALTLGRESCMLIQLHLCIGWRVHDILGRK